jgi:hypothetical protein
VIAQRENDALFRRTSFAQAAVHSAGLVFERSSRTDSSGKAGRGRIRFWGKIVPEGETQTRILRVVTLEDGETVHNAFFDRGFREEEK